MGNSRGGGDLQPANARCLFSAHHRGCPFEGSEQPMSIVGLKIQQAGHVWEVTNARREGPQVRITFRSAADARCRVLGYVDGSGDLPAGVVGEALLDATYRWFPEGDGRVWRAEISPRYEMGALHGHWLIFSAEDGPDREKYAYDESAALGALKDIKLLEYLLRARKGI